MGWRGRGNSTENAKLLLLRKHSLELLIELSYLIEGGDERQIAGDAAWRILQTSEAE
jgi:hypothetical protein